MIEEVIAYFEGDELAANVWIDKYALKDKEGNILEKSPNDTILRIAKEFSRIENKYPNPLTDEVILESLDHFKYIIPAGSPLYGIGNPYSLSSISNCFIKGTRVFTTNGIKAIEDVAIGDIVNTEKGILMPVTQLHKNKLNGRMLFNLKVYKTPVIGVTDNHKFLSITKEQLSWGQCVQQNEVKNLRVGDYIAIPNQNTFLEQNSININEYFDRSFKWYDREYTYELIDNWIYPKTKWKTKTNKICYKRHHPIKNILNIDNDFMYFIGLWYGDGCVFSERNANGLRNRIGKIRNGVRGITFTFNINEKEISEFVISYGETLFGIKPDVNINELQHTIQIVFHSSFIGILFEKLFGKYSYGKMVNKLFFTISNSLMESFLLGLIDSDGCITKDGNLRIVLANKKLVRDLFNIFRNRNIVLGYSETNTNARIDFCKNSEFILKSKKFYNDNRKCINYVDKKLYTINKDGYTLLKIEDKQICNDTHEFVYNIGVENIHSYTVEGLISMNCYVIDSPNDSYAGILKTDEELVQLYKRRGGAGFDISTLRPRGSIVNNAANTSTGAVSFMERYSNTTKEVAQDGRRGALMINMNISHPDIEEFITSKNDTSKLNGCNISVKITDNFMNAVEKDLDYTLEYKIDENTTQLSKRISARKIWNKLIHQAWKTAEPGVLFWDKIISESPADCYGKDWKTISCNPCAELTLCAYDSCRLMHINISAFVRSPFTEKAIFDYDAYKNNIVIAQRLMDDMIDLEEEKLNNIISKIKSNYTDDDKRELDLWLKIKEKLLQGRRTGLNPWLGLSDCLAMLGIKYDSDEAIKFCDKIGKLSSITCYETSIQLAKERGPFPVWNSELEKNNPFLNRIGVASMPRRNISCLTIPPAGTIAIIARTSSGIEPVFNLFYTRKRKVGEGNPNKTFRDNDGQWWEEYKVYHPGLLKWSKITGNSNFNESPYSGSTANEINPIRKIKMIGVIQQYIDHSISQTINLPKATTEEQVSDIYLTAWKEGLKGVTIYRESCRDGILTNEGFKTKFEQHDAPKRSKSLYCDIYNIKSKGQDWTVCVGLLEEKPYEVFAFNHINLSGRLNGDIIKYSKGRYDLNIKDDGYYEDITRECPDAINLLTRMISTSLRHGADIRFIVEQLNKSTGDITSFGKAIARCLKKYISDGQISSSKCPNCNNNLVFEGGCLICKNCGHSKCS